MAQSSIVSAVTMCDLPPEVLEMMAPYLNSKTIRALKCVNKYFYRVFNNDIFWKQYLSYPEKYFLCDLRSCSPAPGVKDIQADISQGRVGKWQGYYKLQKRHLQNWESGLPRNYDTISFPPSSVFQIEEMVDNHGEHWLVFSVCQNSLYIWNITEKPRPLEPATVNPHWKIQMLPQGKLLIAEIGQNGESRGVIAVYQFENPAYELKLEYKFVYFMDKIQPSNVPVDVGGEYNFRFVVTKHIFIGYSCSKSKMEIHLWDLNSGLKLNKVNLVELDMVRAFLNTSLETFDAFDYILNVYPGEFPNVILVIRCILKVFSYVNIFNVQTMQLTLVDQMSSIVSSCSMSADKVCVIDQLGNSVESLINLSIYSLKEPVTWLSSSQEVAVHGKRLKYSEKCGSQVVFKNSKVIIKKCSKVEIIHLDSDNLDKNVIDVGVRNNILGFVEPGLLMVINTRIFHFYYSFYSPSTEVKLYNITTGKELCLWKPFYTNNPSMVDYFKHFQYPNNLVLIFKTEFRVFRF